MIIILETECDICKQRYKYPNATRYVGNFEDGQISSLEYHIPLGEGLHIHHYSDVCISCSKRITGLLKELGVTDGMDG